MRIASYFTPDTTRRCESIIPLAIELTSALRARSGLNLFILTTNNYSS
jgi:hypothetical protein